VDHFEGEDEYYLVMELCKGGDLFTKIVSEGKYSEKRAVRCCKQLASALQWIHKQGITHRDLKVCTPNNQPTSLHSFDSLGND
jgi:serine/threonine protein kinase